MLPTCLEKSHLVPACMTLGTPLSANFSTHNHLRCPDGTFTAPSSFEVGLSGISIDFLRDFILHIPNYEYTKQTYRLRMANAHIHLLANMDTHLYLQNIGNSLALRLKKEIKCHL